MHRASLRSKRFARLRTARCRDPLLSGKTFAVAEQSMYIEKGWLLPFHAAYESLWPASAIYVKIASGGQVCETRHAWSVVFTLFQSRFVFAPLLFSFPFLVWPREPCVDRPSGAP